MENQMTALSSVSIEEKTLSAVLIETLKGCSEKQFVSTAETAAKAVRGAFERMRCESPEANQVGDVAALSLRVTEIVSVLSLTHPELNGR
ncbi:hypothetical protein KOEU_38950 [Komagataeibacter europaeus]|uniref:Uncharacterized protein n=1 Tax=Komagataeibacter europaeus TaxID=33995 RepID=A0A0M0EBG3_KOMEU|nr:hypothetical protein [Komagataeibacter europaeus]KON62622.1 hypothetical protein KOEU_38950 [Komagataeibacter europaeus]